VNDETVQAEPGVNPADVLARTEKDIVRMLSERGGVIATSEFRSVCLGMGVNRTTFYLNLVRSPIISTYGGHLYGLIGSGGRCGTRSSSFVPQGHTGREPDPKESFA